MRRTITDKLAGVFDDRRTSNTKQEANNDNERRNFTERIVDLVKEKGDALISTAQEHVLSVTDTTGAIAKQKLLQRLFSTGAVRSEHIRSALQIGIGYFLAQQQRTTLLTAYTQRVEFPANGGQTPPHSLPDFDFEAYGLFMFNILLDTYGINTETLRQHICQGELKEIVNPSSSGSLLYLTSSAGYLVKTARDYDARFIQQKFLQAYLEHFSQMPGSLLAKLCGVYGYIPYISQHMGIPADSFALRFVIFANIIPTNIDIHEKYDLKGSSYKRDANFAERRKTSATFKDNDFRDLHPQGLTLPKNIYDHLKEVLTRDVDFLEKLNIMDYSLLLTIHNMDNPVRPTRTGSLEVLMGGLHDTFLSFMAEQQIENKNKNIAEPRATLQIRKPNETLGFIYEEIPKIDVQYAKKYGGIPAVNGNGERLLLFIGIIDILQTFDICKVMQRQYQTFENPDVVNERSIVDAQFYAKRFKEFIFDRVFRPDDEGTTASSSYVPAPYNPPTYEQNPSSFTSLYPSMPYYNQ